MTSDRFDPLAKKKNFNTQITCYGNINKKFSQTETFSCPWFCGAAEKNCCLSRYQFTILMNKILCSILAQFAANKHIGIDVKPRPNDRNMSTQHIVSYICCVRCEGCCKLLTLSKQPPTRRKMLQQDGQTHTTCCTQQCCDRLAGAL